MSTVTSMEKHHPSPPPLGCPWCEGDLLFPPPHGPCPPAASHCTSGVLCPAMAYLSEDASLSVSGLGLPRMVSQFHAAFAAHIASSVCGLDGASDGDADDGDVRLRTDEIPHKEKKKKARLESAVDSHSCDDRVDEVTLDSPRVSEEASADRRRHRVRMELAPLIVSATPDEFADVIGPVSVEAEEGKAAAQRHVRPVFYFLECPFTGHSEFVA